MRINQLNHVAVHVSDLGASVRFYGEVLGLEAMDRPAFDFPGAWFRIGVDQELHLIVRRQDEGVPASIPAERHTALRVDDMAEAVAHLRAQGVDFRGPKPRPDGVMQVFLRDPDGHVIELCEG